MNRHDRLLAWLSEQTTGGWAQFKAAHAWLFAVGDAGAVNPRRPSWTAYVLSVLGHLEVDWRNECWSVTPPVLAGLPSAGAVAVLIGSRPARLLALLEEETGCDDAVDVCVTSYPGTDEGPTATYIQYESREAIEALAARLGVWFEPDPANRLSKILPPIEAALARGVPTAPPPASFEVERLDVALHAWIDVTECVTPGLYRYRAFGTDRYQLFDGRQHLEVEREIGVWAAVAQRNLRVLGYRPQEINGTLIVPWFARLPIVQARAAVLCSGIPPAVKPASRSLEYRNVPNAVAERIAQSLGQRLVVDGAR